jgi:hypothetical protein
MSELASERVSMEQMGCAIRQLPGREGSGRVERERAIYNGAFGKSDMAGYAARAAVESSGSERDTMERMG